MVTVFLVVRFGIIAISLFTTLSTKENIYILNKYNNLKYFFIALWFYVVEYSPDKNFIKHFLKSLSWFHLENELKLRARE